MDTLKNYIESLKGDIPSLTNGLGEFKQRAEEEAMSFVNESKEDLIKWTAALANGELSKKDFEWLAQSKKDLLKLNGLKAAGLAEIEAEKFTKELLSLAVNKAVELTQKDT